MTHGVVERLEVVEVEEQHRETALVAPRAVELVVQRDLERAVVRDAGQRIGRGQRPELVVGVAQLAVHPQKLTLPEVLAEDDDGGEQARRGHERAVGHKGIARFGDGDHSVRDGHRDVGQPADPCLPKSLALDDRHRRAGVALHEGRGREERNRDHPQPIDRIAPGVGAVEGDVAVHQVGRDVGHQAGGHDTERAPTGVRRTAEQDRGGPADQHHVANRIRHREDGLERALALGDRRRPEYDVPHDRADAERDRAEIEAEL